MHGTRDEHPEVFKARMQFHKDQKKQQPPDQKDTDDKQKNAKDDKRPLTLTRKPC